MNFIDNPVFVCGHRKSGTTLLISLLDNSENLLTYPDDSGFFYLYHPGFTGPGVPRVEKLARLANAVIRENLGYTVNDPCIPLDAREHLKSCQEECATIIERSISEDLSLRGSLIELMHAFHSSFFPKKTNISRWVEKTTSTEIYALELIDCFPEAKFIHLLRDPRDNWASLKSHWFSRYQEYNDELARLLQSLLERGRLGMQMANANKNSIGDNYHIVKFEDLVEKPDQTLSAITDFLEIDLTSTMFQPSVFGWPWAGNNKDGIEFSAIDPHNVGRWEERIPIHEAQLIEFYFESLMKDHGYIPRFDQRDCQRAATEHYKWFNFATTYSSK